MLSIKSFKHDKYFSNNSKHNLTKCKILKITSDTKSNFNDIAIDNLKQMMINCVIFTYLNKYYYYNFIEYLGINFLNVSNTYVFHDYSVYYDFYYNSKQLHFQQKLLENKNRISNYLNITIYSKYTQIWIINNYKKLPNTSLIIIKCLV